jgi:hypothetical protein
MLTTALLLTLAAADVQPAMLHEGAPRSARLLAYDGMAPPQTDLPDYTGWSKAQLQQEYDRLKEMRPGIGLPIALMSSGGGVLVLSLYILFIGVLSSGGVNNGSLPFVVLFGVAGTGGAAMLVIGGILLSRALPERKPYGRQMDEVDRLIKEQGDDSEDQRIYVPPPPPPIDGPPPEGPPPPPLPPYSPQASVHFPLIFARF